VENGDIHIVTSWQLAFLTTFNCQILTSPDIDKDIGILIETNCIELHCFLVFYLRVLFTNGVTNVLVIVHVDHDQSTIRK